VKPRQRLALLAVVLVSSRKRYFDNAVAAYMNRLRELNNGDQNTSERFLDIAVLPQACRSAGVSYLTAVNNAIKQASENHRLSHQH
jgi:hypothetical protein